MSAPNKKVLIFTYYWPPAGGVAVQRFLKFSKFLPEFGWEPVIITVENGSYPYLDESLARDISPSLRVYRTKTFEPFELYNLLRGKKGKAIPIVSVGSHQKRSVFQKVSEYIRANYFIPDARKGWVSYAVKQAESILKNEKIDAIITTGPPHSTHLIGLMLKKKYGIKWLADLRDPWTAIFYNHLLPRTASSRQKDDELETEVLKSADRVTVISPGMKAQLAAKRSDIEVIYNGYDEEDFATQGPAVKSEHFTIRYVGNLIANQNVPELWHALKALSQSHTDVKIELIGRVDADVKASIDAAGLNNVAYLDFVPHKTAIELIKDSALVLFIIPDVPDSKLIMTGKLFEYIASGTEILALGPVDGDASNVLNMAERKNMLAYNDSAAIKAQLEEAYSQWQKNNTLVKYSADKFNNFSRRNRTAALAKLLNAIVQPVTP